MYQCISSHTDLGCIAPFLEDVCLYCFNSIGLYRFSLNLEIHGAMAIRSAWWMRNSAVSNSNYPTRAPVYPLQNAQSPHRNWPQNLADSGLVFNFLQKYLAEHPGNACQIYQFSFRDLQGKLLWRESADIRDVVELERSLKDRVRPFC